ncbi:uncharacterized protein LACBIDRAFT_333753 [Laccaria bicolor S238N-H82]|uniref:Predicted protein n=1 Tax=Laccaria bicolor (strain S238N-H82 / ATCC MYA-4686) TaxID=486041 RepID=B0DWY7_LACBS|nr:uncharacterized protein LACBIDRAFT_333753 [Laccaria bicolor S238N-H82]EDR00894.1 predicted protein [Laccaria bicolor S238N-H82]|eukprot:XP_001888488.1 predicted protein [Laccaria bicolor S238N-H82]
METTSSTMGCTYMKRYLKDRSPVSEKKFTGGLGAILISNSAYAVTPVNPVNARHSTETDGLSPRYGDGARLTDPSIRLRRTRGGFKSLKSHPQQDLQLPSALVYEPVVRTVDRHDTANHLAIYMLRQWRHSIPKGFFRPPVGYLVAPVCSMPVDIFYEANRAFKALLTSSQPSKFKPCMGPSEMPNEDVWVGVGCWKACLSGNPVHALRTHDKVVNQMKTVTPERRWPRLSACSSSGSDSAIELMEEPKPPVSLTQHANASPLDVRGSLMSTIKGQPVYPWPLVHYPALFNGKYTRCTVHYYVASLFYDS